MHAMEENEQQMPDKIFEIQQAQEDGDLVAVHSFILQNTENLGAAVMHISAF